jgi:diaminopimelate decarboxylase
MKNVELVGLHQHHGRHHPSERYWQAQMKAFAKEIGKVCGLLGGFQPKEIDIGGGFAIRRDVMPEHLNRKKEAATVKPAAA